MPGSRSIFWIMMILSLISIISADRCPFCGREFVSLGRHIWRCPARVTSQASVHSSHVPFQSPVISPLTVVPSGALVFSPPPESDDETVDHETRLPLNRRPCVIDGVRVNEA